MAGLLTGLIASAMGDPNMSFGERFSSNFAPNMYAAEQQRREQAATEAALGQMGGRPLTPGMGHGMALNPNLLNQMGPAVLPQPEKLITNPLPFGGNQYLGQG